MRRNDLAQYEALADEWWRPGGAFTLLHGLAAARARLVPPATRPGAVLVDLGCGAGLLAPHVRSRGYRHLGIDLVGSALTQAAGHGVLPVRADLTRLPLPSASADVVCAGEVLEHIPDRAAAVAEACRVLRPGGTLVVDTLNATALCRFLAVWLAERIDPRIAGIHDPALFVSPTTLMGECARYGVRLRVRGLRPALVALLRWLLIRRGTVTMVPTWTTAVLYQGVGVRR